MSYWARLGKVLWQAVMLDRRTCNKLLNDVQAYLFRGPKLRGYPSRIILEPTSICQLRCPLCPTGQRREGMSKGYLSFENYKKLMDEIGDYLYKITFYNWGEPILHNDLFRMIRDAQSRGIRCHISSNLNYFPPGTARALVESGLYKLTLGVDGVTQETYEAYRTGGNIETVFEAVREINREKERQGKKHPVIVWQYILMRHNQHEVERARELASQLGVQFKVKAVALDGYTDEEVAKWYPDDQEFRRLDYDKKHKVPWQDRCLEFWNQPVINFNGDLFPCSTVYGDEFAVGNVFRDGFLAAWNSPKAQRLRRLVLAKDLTDEERQLTPCGTCRIRKGCRSWSEFFQALPKEGSARRGIRVSG